jgi:hypothetical protein
MNTSAPIMIIMPSERYYYQMILQPEDSHGAFVATLLVGGWGCWSNMHDVRSSY